MPYQQTITKFGVPYNGGGGRGGLLAMKMKYRFRVIFNNFGPTGDQINMTKQVQACGKPSVTYNKATVHAYNSTAYFAGKHQWEPITLTIKDDVTNAASSLVGIQVQKQLNHLEQTGIQAGQGYKFNMQIEHMDGGNINVQDAWNIEGCWLESVKYGDLDYTSTTDFMLIEMSIAYDNAINYGPGQTLLFPQSPPWNENAILV